MNLENGQFQELSDLLEALCEDRIKPQQAQRLELLVLENDNALHFYLNYLDLHGTLHWDTALGDEADSKYPTVISTCSVGESQGDDCASIAADSKQIVESFSSNRRNPSRWLKIAMVIVACSLILAVGIQQYSKSRDNSVATIPKAGSNSSSNNDEVKITEEGNRPKPNRPLVFPKQPPPHTTNPKTPDIVKNNDSDNGNEKARSDPNNRSSDSIVAWVNDELSQSWHNVGVRPSETASDEEWARRLYMDIVGHLPPLDELTDFLADRSSNKREILIEQLLDQPGYIRNSTTNWTNLLVGRSDSLNANRAALQKYLRECFAENRPWNVIVDDFVSAEGDNIKNGETNFLLAHLNNEAVPATAITAQVFLCVQIQCTQCHDHPFYDSKQNEFWEFNSFFQQAEVVRSAKTKLVNERVGGPTFYENRQGTVFAATPKYAGVAVKPDPDVDLRQKLADLLLAGEKPQVAVAMVNRMWGHFFGHSFTPQVDDMGPHRRPSHPKILDRLAREFVDSGYDVKRLIRWICNTDAYQLSSRFNETNLEDNPHIGCDPLFSRVYMKSMTAEQLYDSLIIATGAHNVSATKWTEAEHQRQDWLQQFVVAFRTDENDEVTSFEGTLTQALMMMNGDLVEEALSGSRGTFLHKVARSRDSDVDKIKQLCLAALSREPSRQEIQVFRKILRDRISSRPDGTSIQIASVEGLQDVLWAYLNSSEFILIP